MDKSPKWAVDMANDTQNQPVEYPAPTQLGGYIFIDTIEPVVHLRTPVIEENLPLTIQVIVPNKELPKNELEFEGDLTNDVVKYVRFDNMPHELKNVVRSYLHLLDSSNHPFDLSKRNEFRLFTKSLYEKVLETFPETSKNAGE